MQIETRGKLIAWKENWISRGRFSWPTAPDERSTSARGWFETVLASAERNCSRSLTHLCSFTAEEYRSGKVFHVTLSSASLGSERVESILNRVLYYWVVALSHGPFSTVTFNSFCC